MVAKTSFPFSEKTPVGVFLAVMLMYSILERREGWEINDALDMSLCFTIKYYKESLYLNEYPIWICQKLNRID